MENKSGRIARKLKSFSSVMKGWGQVTFSQYGEDIIMLKMLERYNVKDVTYLDIGANEPINGNNTYNFYLRGMYGALVEPNADLCQQLKSVRSKDAVLNFGIGDKEQAEVDFFMFSEEYNQLNTFSKEDAERTEKEGFPIRKVIKMPIKNINNVIRDNFKGAPTIISLDVEGLDELILRTLDFDKYQPLLICVETAIFTAKGEFARRTNIFELLESKGYFVYADTHVNTIFCSRKVLSELAVE